MFFILSTGRSGTTTIARTLNEVPGCHAVHEPPPELILESAAYHYGELPGEVVKKILLKTRKPVVEGSVYCESNQTLSLLIPVLAESFPEARYVWLIRNGLDVVASTMQKQWYTGHSENHDRYEDCSPIEKAWIDGRIQADKCGEMSPDEWEALSRFGKCCWYWSYVNRIIERDLDKYAPGKFLFIRLEDINEKMAELINWMGLEQKRAPKAGRHNVAKRDPYDWSKWTDEERSTFVRICGPLMDRLYPRWRTPDGEWIGARKAKEGGLIDKVIGGIFPRGKQG